MDTGLQNALSGGTATLELDKLMYIIERYQMVAKAAEDGTAIHQLLEIMLNVNYQLGERIGRGAITSAMELVHFPFVVEACKMLKANGYEFNYEIDPTRARPVKITKLTKFL